MIGEPRVIVMDLPTTIKGFVYIDSTYSHVIVLNARMTHEIQKQTYDHEMNHIIHGDQTDITYMEYDAS